MGRVDEDDLKRQLASPRIWLQQSFPSPLPHLSIDARALLHSPAMQGHATFDRIRARARIQDVQFATEVLEASVVLSTGQVLHMRFGFAQLSETEMINDEVEESIKRQEEQANLLIPPVKSPRGSTHRSSVSIASPRSEAAAATSQALDAEMSKAMQELEVGTDAAVSSSGAPPRDRAETRSARVSTRAAWSAATASRLATTSPAGPAPAPSSHLQEALRLKRSCRCTILRIRATMASSRTSWWIRCAERSRRWHRATLAFWRWRAVRRWRCLTSGAASSSLRKDSAGTNQSKADRAMPRRCARRSRPSPRARLCSLGSACAAMPRIRVWRRG